MQYINKFLKDMSLMIVLGLMSQLVHATSIMQLDINDLMQTAELIFEGKVIASESRVSPSSEAINTYVIFEITDVISGDYSQSTIELSFAGGTAQNLTMQVHGMIYPQLGEKGIYFIEEVGRVLVNPIVGWSQGHFLIHDDSQGAERMYTARNAPIMEMGDQSAPSKLISGGVASGVRTAPFSLTQKPLSKNEFKSFLKTKLSTQSPSQR